MAVARADESLEFTVISVTMFTVPVRCIYAFTFLNAHYSILKNISLHIGTYTQCMLLLDVGIHRKQEKIIIFLLFG